MPNLLHRNRDDKVMNEQAGAYNEPNYGTGAGAGVGQPGMGGQQYQQDYASGPGQPMTGPTYGNAPPAGTTTGTGTGMTHQHQHGTGAGAGLGAGAGAATGAAVGHHHNQGTGNQHTGLRAAEGAGLGAATGAAVGHHHQQHGTHGQDGNLHSSQVQTSSGHSPSSQITMGKLEHAAGAVLCSSTLKAKGDAKVAEGEAVKAQTAELRNAEAMETHAQLARDRANVHAARGNVHGGTHAAVGAHGVGGPLTQGGMSAAPNQAGQALR